MAFACGNASNSTIRVPQDAATLRQAIARADPGDTILLDRGTYPGGDVVPRDKHDITIRGVDRNAVVLDGEDTRSNGIVVHADGVSILNLSAHNFPTDAFRWDGADRFRASYLTVWNVGKYGVYVEDGERGTVDHDYVSGAADAAYYVGECEHCDATISHVVAALSAVGYSGTNASDVVIRDSCLGSQRRRDRPEHVRERGSRAAGARDDPPQPGDEERPGARPAQHAARRASPGSGSRSPEGTRTTSTGTA